MQNTTVLSREEGRKNTDWRSAQIGPKEEEAYTSGRVTVEATWKPTPWMRLTTCFSLRSPRIRSAISVDLDLTMLYITLGVKPRPAVCGRPIHSPITIPLAIIFTAPSCMLIVRNYIHKDLTDLIGFNIKTTFTTMVKKRYLGFMRWPCRSGHRRD